MPGLLPTGAVPAWTAAELGDSAIVNVHVVYDRRVTELELAAGVDSPVQCVFDRTAAPASITASASRCRCPPPRS